MVTLLKLGCIRVKVQFGLRISKDELIKNFFCMSGGSKFIVSEI